MKTKQELVTERNNLVGQMRSMVAKAKDESRDLNTEEQGNYDRIMKAQDAIRAQIDREVELEKIEKELRSESAGQTRADTSVVETATVDGKSEEARYSKVFSRFLSQGMGAVGDELRSLSGTHMAEGGALIPPEQFIASLIKFVDDQVFMRQAATVIKINKAQSLGAPSLDTDVSDADWTSEVATGSEDSSLKFGKRALSPNPLAKRIKVSQFLIQNSALPVESIVQQRLGYKFAVTEEKAFLNGTGVNQPLGVMVASALGIPTTQDVNVGSTSALLADGLISCKYKLKSQYQAKATWLFHRDGVAQIAKLKDKNDQYLWQPSIQAGQPDMLLGRPVKQSEFMPNTFSSALYTGIFGDFSFYWIADVLSMSVQRLVELYAEANQIGFIGRLEVDGMPVLAEAFARVKMST